MYVYASISYSDTFDSPPNSPLFTSILFSWFPAIHPLILHHSSSCTQHHRLHAHFLSSLLSQSSFIVCPVVYSITLLHVCTPHWLKISLHMRLLQDNHLSAHPHGHSEAPPFSASTDTSDYTFEVSTGKSPSRRTSAVRLDDRPLGQLTLLAGYEPKITGKNDFDDICDVTPLFTLTSRIANPTSSRIASPKTIRLYEKQEALAF